ncbi:MAG: hypothetical protein WAO02_02770 [Verrucomicrobiia bacterium]
MSELNFSQELGGQVEVPNRRPAAPQMAPFLVPFYSQKKINPPKRRQEITLEVTTGAEIPHPVKIIHTV